MHSRSQKLHLAELIRDRRRGFLRFLALLAIVAVGFLGFYFILKVVLNAEYPILPVSSNNMCIVQNHCDGFTHTFERTLHVGDLVIVQGVNAKNLRVTYPNSDVVVLHAPKKDSYQEDWLIITRIIAREERDGIIFFRTKGDGEGFHIWPEIPDISECNCWYDYRENYTWNGMISEKLLVGKVILRIPWIGHIMLFMGGSSGIFIAIIVIIILAISKISIPAFTGKEAETERKEDVEKLLKPKAL